MTTITRLEAFAAMEHGEDVEILVQNGDPYRGEWVPAGYQSFAWDKYQAKFRLKPKPRVARVFWLYTSPGNESPHACYEGKPINLPEDCLTKVREVIPSDMTGREMADFVLEGIAQGFGVQQLAESVKVKRDTLPETE